MVPRIFHHPRGLRAHFLDQILELPVRVELLDIVVSPEVFRVKENLSAHVRAGGGEGEVSCNAGTYLDPRMLPEKGVSKCTTTTTSDVNTTTHLPTAESLLHLTANSEETSGPPTLNPVYATPQIHARAKVVL